MVGIIGAMQIEVQHLQERMEQKNVRTISGIEYYQGQWERCEIVVASSGVGKVNAAICTQTMILEYQPDRILNSGVAGSLSPHCGIGSLVIGDSVVQHDMDTTPMGDPRGFLSGIDQVFLPCDKNIVLALEECARHSGFSSCRTGTIASGDQFIHSAAQKQEIAGYFPQAIACEMEGGSIGQVCTANQVPFGILRAISDTADGAACQDYPQFLAQAAQNALTLMFRFLKMHADAG